jgi:hypothetical protein
MAYSTVSDEREIGSYGEINYKVSFYTSDLTKEQRDYIITGIETLKNLLDAENRIERENKLNKGESVKMIGVENV